MSETSDQSRNSCLIAALTECFVSCTVASKNSLIHVICGSAVQIYPDGNVCIIMPLGVGLENYKLQQPLKVRLELARMFILGLIELQDAGIAHGDIKIQNAIVVDGILKLIDFGIVDLPNTISSIHLGVALLNIIYDFSDYSVSQMELLGTPEYPKIANLLKSSSPVDLKDLLESKPFEVSPRHLTPRNLYSVYFEPVGLQYIYSAGLKYQLSGGIISNASVRFAGISDPRKSLKEAMACLLISIGLANKSNRQLEQEFCLKYTATDAWDVIQHTIPKSLNYNFNSLHLIGFCHSRIYCKLIPNIFINSRDCIIHQATEFCKKIHINLTKILVTECTDWILEL